MKLRDFGRPRSELGAITSAYRKERMEVLVPDLDPKPEIQEEFGWENLDRFADEAASDRAAEEEQSADPGEAQPVEEESQEAAQAPAVDEAAVEAAGATAEMTEAQAAKAGPDEVMYTLPGGRKITKQELVDDPELLEKLVTHSNQVSLFQRLAEERKAEMEKMQAEHRQALDQFTSWQMQMQAQQAQQQQQPQPERPPSAALEAAFAPHLDNLVKQGRLTEDQRSEFGPVIAEYLFDHKLVFDAMREIYRQGSEEIASLKSRLENEIAPTAQQFQERQLIDQETALWQEASSIPGYEALKDPNEWNRLKTFVYEKMVASPKDQNGRPTFDPVMDAQTAAQLYDAMTGAEMRAAIAAEKAKQTAAADRTGAMVAGETSAKAGTPPKKPARPMTEEEDAMSFGDPSMAIG